MNENQKIHPWEKWGALMATCLMVISGAAYFGFKYWIESDDPFRVVNHPLEPVTLHVHILAGPVLIFLFGLLFRSHVQVMFKRRSKPAGASGMLTVFLFFVTVLSGYLLQTVTMPVLHEALAYLHPVGGLCFVFVFGLHSLRKTNRISAVGTANEERHLVA